MKTIIGFTLVSFLAIVFGDFQQCLKSSKYKADIITRDDDRYPVSNYQFNIRNMIYPIGYLGVKSACDVQKVIRCAKQNNVHLSIICGRHSSMKYSFGDNQSWVIDVSKLSKIKINREKGIAIIGSGNRLQYVTDYLWNCGKYGTTVGSCYSVGISGFALGGGFGLNARKYGLGVDRTVGYEIVTADSNILQVTQESYPDLFWALRGGGPLNFGVVTKFHMKIFDASNEFVWVRKIYNYNEFRSVYRRWQEWAGSTIPSSITSNIRKDSLGTTDFILHIVINNENIDDSNAQLSSVRQYFPEITDGDIYYGSYREILEAAKTPFFKIGDTPQFYSREKGFLVSRVLQDNEVDDFLNIFDNPPHFEIMMETFGGAINKPSRTDTAFVHRDSIYFIQFRFTLFLTSDTTEEEVNALGRQYEEQLKQLFQQLQFMSNDEVYQNNADADLKNWAQVYYAENLPRLKEIKAKYDRSNFFHYEQSIPLP